MLISACPILFYILVRRFKILSERVAKWRSQKQAIRENQDSDCLNKDFDINIWSASLTCSWSKLTNLQMILFIFDRFIALFLGSVVSFCFDHPVPWIFKHINVHLKRTIWNFFFNLRFGIVVEICLIKLFMSCLFCFY